MFCLNISGKCVPLYLTYSVYPKEDKGCERVDNIIIVIYVGSGVRGLVNSLNNYVSHRNVIWGWLLTVSFNGQTPLLLVTQNIDLQTHKRLNFWATFESLESFGNHLKSLLPAEFARKYRREDYYRIFWCTVNITGLILLIMQPSCFSLLTVNLVTAGHEYCPQLTCNSSQ